MANLSKYSKEMSDWLKKHAIGRPYKDIAADFNKLFNTDISHKAIMQKCHNLGLFNGLTGGRFTKGHIPVNKGKKVSEYTYRKIKKTMFKPGHTPANHRPVGSERISTDGYTYIKTAEPNKWMAKHVFVWEQHFNQLNKNEALVFLDGNRQNCAITNLYKITRSELARLNQNHLLTDIPELNKSALRIAQLLAQIGERKNGNHRTK